MNKTSIWEEEKNFLTKFPHNFRFFNWVLRGRFKKENSLVPKVTQSVSQNKATRGGMELTWQI